MICRVYCINSNSKIMSIGHALRATCAPTCNMRHYIALYNICCHGFYWSVRLIKRNKSLCEMVQKEDLKNDKGKKN